MRHAVRGASLDESGECAHAAWRSDCCIRAPSPSSGGGVGRACGAGRRIPAGIAYEAFAPASFRHRRALLVRNAVGNPSSGVISSPEGASHTGSRRNPRSRRQFLAGGRVSAASADTIPTRAPASLRKTRSRWPTAPRLSATMDAQTPIAAHTTWLNRRGATCDERQ